MTGRGCPVPPIGRGWGPERSSCAGEFAGVLAVARCSGSVVTVTGATGIAASDAGKKRVADRRVPPTGSTSKARRDGSITATTSEPTGNAAASA